MLDHEVHWHGLLPAFVTMLGGAALRASQVQFEPPLEIELDLGRIAEPAYRSGVVATAAAWRGREKKSTLYTFTFPSPVPQELITSLVNDARENAPPCNNGKQRAFSRCNSSISESACLYVGRSLTFDRRLRDHLGDGSGTTSSLHLKHWSGHPERYVSIVASSFSTRDDYLAGLLEDYLWDSLCPLLGKRGGK